MKTLKSNIKIIKKNLSSDQALNTLILDLENSFKKDEIYTISANKIIKENSYNSVAKNIFLNYSQSVYSLYLDISNILKEVCREYEINQSKQKYMIYGKISKYSELTNRDWYDFPGINKPSLHGFYFPQVNACSLTVKNNDQQEAVTIQRGDIIINKPTDIINIKTDAEIDVVEFYIMPNILLKHNEPGVWCPIL